MTILDLIIIEAGKRFVPDHHGMVDYTVLCSNPVFDQIKAESFGNSNTEDKEETNHPLMDDIKFLRFVLGHHIIRVRNTKKTGYKIKQ